MEGARPANTRLDLLRPGQGIRIGDAGYLIERSLVIEDRDMRWTEHRLSSDGSGHSCWLEVPDDDAKPLVLHERSDELASAPEPEGCGAYRLEDAGTVSYRTLERAGPPKTGRLIFVEYSSGDDRLTFERERVDEPWQVWRGRTIDRSAVCLTHG